MEHWFWLGLVGFTLTWYVVVTAFVAVRGAKDIRNMLRDLKDGQRDLEEG